MSEQSNVSEGLALVHLRKIVEAEQKKDEAVAKLRTARKAAKNDGVDLKALDAARALSKLDAIEVTNDFNQLVRYSKFLEVPVYSQLSMFDIPAEPTDEDLHDRAYSSGVRAGKLGHDQTSSKFEPGSPAGQKWLEGYSDGQKIIMSAMQELAPPPAKGRKH